MKNSLDHASAGRMCRICAEYECRFAHAGPSLHTAGDPYLGIEKAQAAFAACALKRPSGQV